MSWQGALQGLSGGPWAPAGGSTQVPVTVVDESGREWPMTYRCVPHRYSYELRAGVGPSSIAALHHSCRSLRAPEAMSSNI